MPAKSQLLIAIAASLLLVMVPLSLHLSDGEYVIAHDANVPATPVKAIEQFELLKPQNGGLVQGIVPPISFMTALLYGLPMALGAPVTAVQVGVMTATFAMVLLLAIAGFDRLLAGAGRPRNLGLELDAALLGALYIVAPFTLVYVSYGVFWSVNIALAIGVLPLLVHFFVRCFLDERDDLRINSVSALALCVIVVAWSILFIFPALLIGLAMLVARGGFTRTDAVKLAMLGALVSVGSLVSLYGMYVSVIDAGWQIAFDPIATNAAWAHIRGGVLTGFLQYSAWTIYTQWTPRLLLGFPSHFFSLVHVSLTILLLGMAALFPLLAREGELRRRFLLAAMMFLVAVFFVKGGGEPFGALYTGMLSIVPGAGLVRTPDTKFGVFVLLGIAVALAFVLACRDAALRKYRAACRFFMVLAVVYHALPLVNGQAILGARSELAPDQSERGYAVEVTTAERHIAEALQREPATGVVVLPPNFGTTRREGGIFAYRSVIGEFVSNPLYYAEWDEMPNESVKEQLRRAVDEGAWSGLPDLGVGFLLVNRNAINGHAGRYAIYSAARNSPQAWEKIVDEEGYELWRLRDALRKPRVALETPDGERPLEVAQYNGWLAITRPANFGERSKIRFRSAENSHWRLLLVHEDCHYAAIACVLRALVAPPSAWRVTREPSASFLDNRWVVEAPHDAHATAVAIVFLPQLVMYALLALSIVTAFTCVWLARRPRTSRQS